MRLRFIGMSWLLLLCAACSRQPSKSEVEAASNAPEPVVIELAAAESRKVERTISVTGSLHPDESVSVSAEVAGILREIRVDFGQQVRKGEVIAVLDSQESELQLERSRAALAQALARVGLSSAQENISPDTTPAIRQALAQLEDIRFKYESAARLLKSGDISRERFTELEKAYHAREAALDATRNELHTELASIQALQAEVKLAQKRVNDATVRAPFDGAVTAKLVSPGQYIKDNAPIVTLVKTSPLRLRAEIPEFAASSVRIGTSLTFTTDAAPNTHFEAVVRELNPALDPKSRTLTLEARLNVPDRRLRPGMFVQVRLVLEKNITIVVVPKKALYIVAGLTKVFVVQNDRVVEHRIPPGQEVGDWVEVPSDRIREGQKLAVSNLASLVDGTPVKGNGPASPKG
jgi:membrane fusion protein, multidrug efflux system